MCGIVGMLTYSGGANHWRGQIEHACGLMARRGPDAAGIWSDGEHCVLGFRRLSVLDLSAAGDQPMLTRDGRYALVFNGELYNFRELRNQLEDRGVLFRSSGDAEVVLYALAEFGTQALERFNGMFALAFYDTRTRRLLLARDHAAIKPLYILRHRDGLLFASQYNQITSHPWARAQRVNSGAFALYLNLGYIPPPFGLLDGSAALEAGAWITADSSGKTSEGRHYTFPQAPEPDLFGAAAHEAVDAAVAAAVRRQMVSDVPVGVLLSGGIDSPLVAAKMRQATNAPIAAFTLSAGYKEMDEAPDAQRYAQALGLSHEIRRIQSNDIVELLDEVVAAYTEPHDDYSVFPTALISRVARQHVTVALSGDGGDDIFWGYPERMIRPLNGLEVKAAGLFGLFNRAIGRRAQATVLPGAEKIGADQLRRHRFVNAGQLAAIFPSLPSLPQDFLLFRYDGAGVDALAQWLRWNEYSGHLGRVLQKVDRASMHYSLEVRVPLLDREVIDVAARVDWRSAVDLKREVGKLPLRASLQRHAGFQTIRKRGFTVPMAAWLRGPLRPVFEDKVLSRDDLLGLPIDRNEMAQLFRRHRMRLEDSHWLLWRLLSLALWQERHFKPQPAQV